jgi:hypothetical protein
MSPYGAVITGAIYADGALVETPAQMARMSAYVEQEVGTHG